MNDWEEKCAPKIKNNIAVKRFEASWSIDWFSTDQIKNASKVMNNLLVPGGYCRAILTLESFKNWRLLIIDSDAEEWFYDVAVIDNGILSNSYQ
eukprot:13336614-Ditylum_brightwellii.AAC.1